MRTESIVLLEPPRVGRLKGLAQATSEGSASLLPYCTVPQNTISHVIESTLAHTYIQVADPFRTSDITINHASPAFKRMQPASIPGSRYHNVQTKKQKRCLTTLVSQRRKTLTIEELSDSEMLLNRESNPGLPRLVNCEVTTEVVVSG
jgi:hypothetical protein